MQIDTRSAALSRTNSTNSTTAGTSIANPATSLTAPSGDGVIALGHDGAMSANGLLLLPYGTDTDDQTFLMSVFAWDVVRKTGSGDTSALWVAYPLATFTCTLSAITGLAGTEVDNTNLFCDTITLGVGNANVSNEIVTGGSADVLAHVVLDVKGVRFVEVKFARNSSAVSMNALYRRI